MPCVARDCFGCRNGNYVRITGVVNGQGDFIASTTPLPVANEYLFKVIKVRDQPKARTCEPATAQS